MNTSNLNKSIIALRKTFRLNSAKKLLTPYWHEKNKKGKIHSIGFCYIATEALFHLIGGEKTNYRPAFYKKGKESHWWLVDNQGKILDPTKDQFKPNKPQYHLGKRIGFQNGYKKPSKKAAILIELIKHQSLIVQ